MMQNRTRVFVLGEPAGTGKWEVLRVYQPGEYDPKALQQELIGLSLGKPGPWNWAIAVEAASVEHLKPTGGA